MNTQVKAAAEILQSEDGPRLLVRAADLAGALEIAHGEAAGEDYVLADPESAVPGWVRAVPCKPSGHELDGWWCEGQFRCHYIRSRPGPGSFRGTFFDLEYVANLDDDDPRRARYLAECEAMEKRSA